MSAILLDFDIGIEGHPYPIFARSGWEIPQPSQRELEAERQPDEILRLRTFVLIDEMARHGSRQVKIRSLPKYLYNCVGMVLANRRAWIEIDHIIDVLREDGYRLLARDQVVAGDVVVYNLNVAPVHVGLVVAVEPSFGNLQEIRVLSKWGLLGEVEHRDEDVPYHCGRPSL